MSSGAPVTLPARWRRALLKSDLPSPEKLVGVVWLEYVNTTSHQAWPAVRTLAAGGSRKGAHSGLGERRIRTALARLQEEAWIAEVKARPGTSTIYRINPLHVVQDPLHVLPPTPARGAAEVELEVEQEEISGADQLAIEEWAKEFVASMRARRSA